jgi:uncharacterized OB-fold protein
MAVIPPDLPMSTFPGQGALAELSAPSTEAVRPQRDALAQGRLLFQSCDSCGRLRGQVAPVCPFCRARTWRWRDVGGRGTVVSWVRYHRAYLEAFKSLVPYVVLCVELDEGIRIFGRLARQSAVPAAGLRVSAIIERWADGGAAAAFVPLDA